MINRTVVLVAAVVLALALAWYAMPLPDGGVPAEPPAAPAPVTQPAPAPAASPAEAPKQ
jgi:hypothetical protein